MQVITQSSHTPSPFLSQSNVNPTNTNITHNQSRYTFIHSIQSIPFHLHPYQTTTIHLQHDWQSHAISHPPQIIIHNYSHLSHQWSSGIIPRSHSRPRNRWPTSPIQILLFCNDLLPNQ
jgi:hypothetical protein